MRAAKKPRRPTLRQLQAWRKSLQALPPGPGVAWATLQQLDRYLGRMQAWIADRDGVPPVSP